MKRLLPLVPCLLLSLLVSGAPAADRRPSQILSVAAYNIENAFDVFDDPYTADEETEVKPRDQWAAIARALRKIDADVVAFSEIENEHLLRSMVDRFLGDRGYRYVAVVPTNDRRGIHLGLASRLPIRSLTSHRWQSLTLPEHPQEQWRFARDLLHATLEAPDGRPLHLFVVHFKSKRPTDGDPKSTLWRTAEAAATRRIVQELLERDPKARVLVAGDFNSEPDERPMSTLLADPGLLTDLHRSLPAADRVTYPGTTFPDAIFDYILASPAMARCLVPGSPGVLADPALTGGSDHRPVFARFDLTR